MEFANITALIIVGSIGLVCLAILAPLILGFITYIGALAYTYVDKTFNEKYRLRRARHKSAKKKVYHFPAS